MNADLMDRASAFFDLNIQLYPNSTNVYDSKGDCLLAQGDTMKALESFRKALEVGDNNYTQQKIDMLKRGSEDQH
jgi:predicted negative regulator of RcsB-dependent stress response